MKTPHAAALIAAAVLALPATAKAADDAVGAWTIFTTTGAFDSSSKWRYWFDGQARYPDVGSGANQYVLRPAVGYQLDDRTSAWAGYARFRTRSASGNVVDEDRYWQQVNRVSSTDAGTLTLRARLEQRVVETGDDTGLVLRTMARFSWPLDGNLLSSAFVGIEPFFALRDTDWGSESGFAQNRVFAGLEWRLSNSLALQTSYMHQYLWRAGAEDRSNHLAVFNFRKRF